MKEKKIMRVLDLFAGTQSVRKQLNSTHKIDKWNLDGVVWKGERKGNVVVEYIGVDIKSPEDTNLIFDLSAKDVVNKFVASLPGGWKPNVIWASPLCTTFSTAVGVKGGTICYELTEDKKIKLRTDWDAIQHKAYNKHKSNPAWQDKFREKGKLGLMLWNNTKEIIKHFGVPYAVENPANALSRYLADGYGHRTVTHYRVYGFDYKKATAIYSNVELKLNKCNHKKHTMVMSGKGVKASGIVAAPSSNKDRSVVPPLLIEDIMEQLMSKKGSK